MKKDEVEKKFPDSKFPTKGKKKLKKKKKTMPMQPMPFTGAKSKKGIWG